MQVLGYLMLLGEVEARCAQLANTCIATGYAEALGETQGIRKFLAAGFCILKYG